jgi:hypothetical protein
MGVGGYLLDCYATVCIARIINATGCIVKQFTGNLLHNSDLGLGSLPKIAQNKYFYLT